MEKICANVFAFEQATKTITGGEPSGCLMFTRSYRKEEETQVVEMVPDLSLGNIPRPV